MGTSKVIKNVNEIKKLAEVPYGYCKCGCGSLTPLATRNDSKQGLVKGRPRLSIGGHQNKRNPYGYILDNISIDSETGCWNWTGSKFQSNGRPRWMIGWYGDRKTVTAYRAVYELFVEQIPEGLLVCHSCDNPICVNPNHLWLGTSEDNLKDASRKGRLVTGKMNRARQEKQLKLDELKVKYIRSSDESPSELATKFSVSDSLIHQVRNRTVWKDVD